jgi:hypothetical protein
MNYEKPNVIVRQKLKQIPVVQANPTLPACIIGSSYSVRDGYNAGKLPGINNHIAKYKDIVKL